MSEKNILNALFKSQCREAILRKKLQSLPADVERILNVIECIDRFALLAQTPTHQQLRLWTSELEDAIDISDEYLQQRREERERAKGRMDSFTVTLELLDKLKRNR